MDIIYSFLHVFLLFFIYSVIGYLCEIIYCFFYNHGKVQDRGFLYGPYCPIYGFGSLIILFFLKKYENDPLILFTMSIVLTSLLEYITSYLMEKIFENKWWDYSDQKFNLNGRICLLNSFLFGILGLTLVYFINPFISGYVLKISNELQFIISGLIFLLLVFDTIKSSNTAFHLKSKLKIMKQDINNYIEEERNKISQRNKENLEDLEEMASKMKEKISTILDGKSGAKLDELIKKLPDLHKLNEIAILKHHISRSNSDKK